jgi:CubicO group peptidase (beta-lactamase class C family)
MIPQRRAGSIRGTLLRLVVSLAALLAPAGAGVLAPAGAGVAAPGPPVPLTPLPAQPPDVAWPTRQWPTGPLSAAVSPPALEQLLAVVGKRDPLLGETRAVVIVHGGRLVLERYAPGFGADTPLVSWSVAKSITQALVGIAVGKRLVDIDRPMGNPRWAKDDPRAAITWRQWMNMVDGQQFREIGVSAVTENDSARMLFGQGRLDVAAFAAAIPVAHPPGRRWNYNSGGVSLMAEALGRVFAPDATAPAERRARMAEVMSRELFVPLGMTSANPQFDATGTFLGSALFYATARDYARFGLLYLRDGVWEGRRLLPPGWVDLARTGTRAEGGGRYGAGWWIEPAPGADVSPRLGSPSASAAPDMFTAQGFQGQLIMVVPSRDLVVVRLGLIDDRVGWPPLRQWSHRLVALFPPRQVP